MDSIITINNPIILFAQLGYSDDNLYVQVEITDPQGNITVSNLTLKDRGYYFYSYTPLLTGTYNLRYFVYTDSSYTIISPNYQPDTDSFLVVGINASVIAPSTGNYSTIAQLRQCYGLFADISAVTDAQIQTLLDDADQHLRVDLSNIIDFTKFPNDHVLCPPYINVLSQHKTAELCTIYKFGITKNLITGDALKNYWGKQYDELIQKIKDGDIDIISWANESKSQMDYVNNVKRHVPPALGTGQWGEYQTNCQQSAQNNRYGGHKKP